MKRRQVGSLIGSLLALTGFLLIGAVFYPLLSYEIKSRDFVQYISPVPLEASVDYTKVSSWFAGSASSESVGGFARYYNLTVPRLGIKDAVVTVGGEDLSDSLIQYPGTALPGKPGTTVVFGHSVLPAFFDPKVYLTIFSTLPTMKKQDEIKIDYDGISYQYRVQEMYEVTPDNLEVLSQSSDSSYISLITCVPPGDPRRPRRLVVRAKLVPPQERGTI